MLPRYHPSIKDFFCFLKLRLLLIELCRSQEISSGRSNAAYVLCSLYQDSNVTSNVGGGRLLLCRPGPLRNSIAV
ncbi:hypothetical protein QBC42DRAFT_275097 [Cladorrhinum samala]|uniref:Uncharacterized protein n=1 Tax=Cladorrhinum samala TaxID=585594 RepID=A0AAV9HGY1_9PEZI|nr:hypothetical protein QBC42DRAFT_275097 [Cladorrhinum samala]